MKYKKLILLSCLLLALLTIGAVSAQDDATVGINDNGDVLEVDNDLSSSNDVLKESWGTFTDLNNLINSGENETIYLDSDYRYDDYEDSDLIEGIVISRNMTTINGNGHTIDGYNAARIFTVDSEIIVEFRDIIFVNGNADNFEAPVAGAVWGSGSDYTKMINCTFTGNSAEYGGAISSVHAIDCTFTDNSAYYGGAALGCVAENCIFNNNTADFGGAIYQGDAINSSFNDNQAYSLGGAIYEVYECEDCSFTHNTAQNGGAIYIAYEPVLNAIFTENYAEQCGGALDTGDALESTFIGNTAENYGGAIFNGFETDCIFEDNTAGIDGDDTYIEDPDVIIVDLIYYEDVNGTVIEYWFPQSAEGNISVYIDGAEEPCYTVDVPMPNYGWYYEIYANELEGFELIPGSYEIEVVYSGDGRYGEYSWTDTLEVTEEEVDPDENITDDYNITFSEYHNFNQNVIQGRQTYDAAFEFPFIAEGVVSIYVDDVYYGDVEVEYGDAFAEVDTSDLDFGMHDVLFEYSGDDYFKPSSAHDSFNVTYIKFEVPSIITEDGGMSATTALVAMPFDATGTVKLIVDDIENATDQIEDGNAVFSLRDLAYGNHTVELVYQNGNYPDASKKFDVESLIVVSKKDPNLSVSVDDINVGETAIVNVLMDTSVNGNVLVDVNDVEYTVNVVNGKGSQSVSGLTAGSYEVFASFDGDENYLAASDFTEFAVNKIDTDISAVYNDGTGEVVATLTNGATGQVIKNANVRFIVGDKKYTVKTDASGKAIYSTANLDAGTYTVTASYEGNSKYNPSSASVDVIVKARTAISIDFNNGAREIVATLINDVTGQAIKNANVRFEVNGVKSTVKSDDNGQAKVSVANLALGTYEASASYIGNSKYIPSNASVDFTITKIMTSISQYYDETTQELVATLINSETGQAIKGATIVFNYNGVKTAAKTDKLGQARLHIGDPVVESASLSYGGNSKYLRSYGSIKLDIDKVSTVISNFYYKETQEVVATLINRETGQAIKGATVVFNFNGVKTALKTDKLGQVKLSVADLVPDEYYISSSYGGNSKYAGSVARIYFIKI